MIKEFPAEYDELIRRHGYMILKVAPVLGSGDRCFAYTIGLSENYGHPEILCFSIGADLSYSIVRAVAKSVVAGSCVEVDVRNYDYCDYPYYFKSVCLDNYREYLGFAYLRYGMEFKCYQCFWPDDNFKYPWDVGNLLTVEGGVEMQLDLSLPM